MKTVKPGAISLLTRTVEHRGHCYFIVSPILFVSFAGQLRLKSEAALWKFAAAELGKDAAIDVGMPKGRPEFLVHARVFAPDGKPVRSCAVRARFGEHEKVLYVFGDRNWKGREITEPQPFTEMAMHWSRAFGGPGFAANVEGKGAAKIDAEASIWPLPNLEYPGDALQKPGQSIKPAGYGPRPITHPERMALVGTYDDRWLKTDFPGLARDVDWKHFNLAPPDQWLSESMTGSESWEFENLHPTSRIVRGQLPGFSTRCFIVRQVGAGDRFEEIATRFDTVWFFPEHECAILVGRGHTEVTQDDAADIRIMVAAVEWGGENRPDSYYENALRKRLDPEKGHYFLAQEDDLLPSGIGERYRVERLVDGSPESPTLLGDNLRKRQVAEIERARAVVASYGLDPDADHAPKLPEASERPPQKLEELPAYLEKMQLKATQLKAAQEEREAKLDQERRAVLKRADVDFSVIEAEYSAKPKGPPTFTAKATFDTLSQLRSLMEAQQGPVAELDQYLADPAFRQRMVDAERKSKESYRVTAHLQSPADAMAAERAVWVKQRAAEHFRSGKPFAGIDLTGADLSGMNLSGADFSGAFLESVNFSGCQLVGCNFKKAVLARTNLASADLTGANLAEANLGEAACEGTVFDRANLEGAILRGAKLHGARFVRAVLRRVDLTGGAHFAQTDWSEADASDVTFVDADLKGLACRGANLERSVFVRCDFAGVDFSAAKFARAVFVKPKGAGAAFRGAEFKGSAFVGGSDLRGADFTGAQISTTFMRPAKLDGARFDRARLKEADLSECSLQHSSFAMAMAVDSRFIRADLSKAFFASSSLMNSNLQKANLAGAEFRDANLHAADLARVTVDDKTVFSSTLTTKTRTYPRAKRADDGGGEPA
jgi:uncharacterized protein YjbI with pentapeptide repeats